MLSNEELERLAGMVLPKTGLPDAFNGDRLDAHRLGVLDGMKAIRELVSMDPEKPQGKSSDEPERIA